MNPRQLVIGGFVITVFMISWTEIRKCDRLPYPSRIVMTGLTFGLIDLLALVNAELGGVVAVGVVLAAIVNGGFVKTCNKPITCKTTAPPQCGSAILG